MLTTFLSQPCTPPQLIPTYFTDIISSPLYRQRNRSPEKLSYLLRVTEQSKGTAGSQAQWLLIPKHVPLPSHIPSLVIYVGSPNRQRKLLSSLQCSTPALRSGEDEPGGEGVGSSCPQLKWIPYQFQLNVEYIGRLCIIHENRRFPETARGAGLKFGSFVDPCPIFLAPFTGKARLESGLLTRCRLCSLLRETHHHPPVDWEEGIDTYCSVQIMTLHFGSVGLWTA